MKTVQMNKASSRAIVSITRLKDIVKSIIDEGGSSKKAKFGPIFYEMEKSTYTGNYLKGQRSGYGEIVYGDGSLYYGNWSKDLK